MIPEKKIDIFVTLLFSFPITLFNILKLLVTCFVIKLFAHINLFK